MRSWRNLKDFARAATPVTKHGSTAQFVGKSSPITRHERKATLKKKTSTGERRKERG